VTGGDEPSRPEFRDPTEFSRLFVQNQRRVFAHIFALVPRFTDAEEIFQQTCVIILSKADQYVPGTRFASWACQIAQYEVFNYRRRLQAEHLRFDDDLLDQLAACRLERDDLLEAELDAMRRCVELLPPVDRHLIQSQYTRKITSRALAAELGRPANTVYKALQRIRLRLRECIERAVSREQHDERDA
jgi:RNA polymerase sigma-70 factor, ECF subfamily